MDVSGDTVFSDNMWRDKFRSHGDPFPLDSDWIVHSAEAEGLCFPQRGAWAARALNTLALQCSNSNSKRSHRSLPTKPQLELGGRILQRLQEAGTPSPDMSGSDALSSLMGSKGLYNEEPQNLAVYDYDKVKVLKSQLQPRRLESVLPDHAKMILRRHETLIQKPRSQVHLDGDCGITPYWDPKLRRSKQELVRLVVGLANQGLVTFRTAIRERIGLFFVKKKTPDWIRMVIDSRRVNELHLPLLELDFQHLGHTLTFNSPQLILIQDWHTA